MRNIDHLMRFLKEWTLPCAIAVGTIAYLVFTRVDALQAVGEQLGKWINTLFPCIIFLILLTTFCKVDFKSLRPARWSLSVTISQLTLVAAFLIIALSTHAGTQLIAVGALSCAIAPCATAAPVVSTKLGGDINRMTTYVLLSNLLATFTITLASTLLTPHDTWQWGIFFATGFEILGRLSLVLVLPLIIAWLLQRSRTGLQIWIAKHRDLPFYLWCIALAITTGVTISGIDHADISTPTIGMLALVSLLICLFQFYMGRRLGRRHKETPYSHIEAGQALGQKNTGLIIWATVQFLHPAAALAPGCYVLWQNIINSWQLHKSGTQR